MVKQVATNSASYVDMDAMQRGATVMLETSDQITQIGNSVDQTVSAIASSFTGQTATTFLGALQTWREQYQQIASQLVNMHDLLAGNQKNYIANNSDQQSTAATFRAQLG